MLAIELKELEKTYEDGTVAVKGLNLEIEQGEFYALLGANGAGKSTTIGMISSLVTKTAGVVKVAGFDLDTEPREVKKRIGLVPQEFNFSVFEKVEEVLAHQAGYFGVPKSIANPRIDTLLKQLGLENKRLAVSRTLSGGMKRKLMIARALLHEPEVLILDEPTAGVDVETRRQMWDFLIRLNQSGTTILLTTHYLEEAEKLCKRVAIIDQGRVLTEKPIAELLSQLESERYQLVLDKPFDSKLDIPGFSFSEENGNRVIVEFALKEDLTTLAAELSKNGLRVRSLAPVSNRLEEMFIGLTSKKGNLP